jgi:hypothetical protein
MGRSTELYQEIHAKLKGYHPEAHVRRLANWVWVIVGLIQSQSVHLSAIASAIPSAAAAAGRVTQVRRWLANTQIDSRLWYRPLIRQVLHAWRGRQLLVILDGTYVNGAKLQVLRFSLSHCYRALPLCWQVLEHKGNVRASDCRALLDELAVLVGQNQRVTILADRGFRGRGWARAFRSRNWHYIIRLPINTHIGARKSKTRPAAAWLPKRGALRALPHMYVTHRAFPCHLFISHPPTGEPWLLMSSRYPSKWLMKHYAKRMHIEESFRDEQSGGFDLAASRLTDTKRLEMLLLALAVATLWLFQLGESVLRDDQRKQIDPAAKRQLSIFQLGWRFLKRALACFEVPPFSLDLKPLALDPVWRPKKC